MEHLPVLVLIIGFIFLLMIGVPIAWSIGLSSLLTLLVSVPAMPSFTTIAQRIATGLDNFTLLAIPFFILSGQLMNKGGIAQRLINFAKTLVGSLPGGLAHINVMAAMLMGAISGSAVAAVSAIGGILGPQMEKEGYPKEFSAAVNISSGTMGLIIPPSNTLIVYALASGGISVAALFLAGYLPGILTGIFIMFVAAAWAKRNNLPVGERNGLRKVFKSFIDALPSLFLLVVVIGGIVAGVFTATEASAIAVLYTFILAFWYKEITYQDLPGIILNTVGTTAVVMLLVGTSMSMSWVMSFENIPQDVSQVLLSISENKFVVLIVINLILLFVGMFMDITPAILIFTPIFLPIVTKMGVDPVHFGIIMVLNLCIGLCTPPVGSVLFVGVSVAKTTIEKVIKPLLPIYIVMIIVLLLVTYFPQLSLWLPGLFGY